MVKVFLPIRATVLVAFPARPTDIGRWIRGQPIRMLALVRHAPWSTLLLLAFAIPLALAQAQPRRARKMSEG